ALVGAIVMLLAAPAVPTAILALMLLFEAWIFGSAPWASFAAEGIQLTPFRRIYGRSAQNTGERPDVSTRAAAFIPGALAPVEIVKVVPLEHHALDAKGRPGAELRGRLIRCPDDPATPPQLLRRGCRGHVRKRTKERLHPAALFGNLVRIAADQRAAHPGAP